MLLLDGQMREGVITSILAHTVSVPISLPSNGHLIPFTGAFPPRRRMILSKAAKSALAFRSAKNRAV